jgi:hypothetical protein
MLNITFEFIHVAASTSGIVIEIELDEDEMIIQAFTKSGNCASPLKDSRAEYLPTPGSSQMATPAPSSAHDTTVATPQSTPQHHLHHSH